MAFLLDVNVLIALSWPQHVHHATAHAWFSGLGDRPWATTALTETAFLRLSTNRHVVHRPLLAADAVAALVAIRGLPGHVFLPDDTSLAAPSISLDRLASGGQITDLHLVNLAAVHRAVLTTLDRSIPAYLSPQDQQHVHVI